MKAKRRIQTAPEKVLDAPGLLDDYYLNLLDWSSKNVLAIALDKNVYVWNADTGEVQEFCTTEDDNYVSSLQFTGDGSYLAVGTFLGETEIWDVGKSSKVRTMRGHSSRVSVLSWDKHIVSSGSRTGNIFHHDVRVSQHKTAELHGHSGEVCGLKWRPDGQMLASGGNDNLVHIWDARSIEPSHTKSDHIAAVKAVSWCPWQLSLLSTGGGTLDKQVYFWNSTTGSKLNQIDTGSQVTSIIWSREYKEFATSHGFPNNQISVWSYPTLNRITDLPGHDSRILHSVLSPDAQVMATASDENLKFWRIFESKKKTEDLVSATRRLAIR
jgi:cell division cycle protein 20 (cofactor of APC complex)